MQETVNQNRSELWNMSFRDLFYKYVRFLPLFIFSVALTLFGAYIYLRYSIPIYNVGGSMVIKSEQTGGGRSQKFEDVFVNDKAQNIQNEIEILKSRPLMQRVIDSLHLQFTYYAKGKIKTVNIYKQSPFLINAINITDSSSTFSIKVKLLNDHEFRINSDKQTYTYGQTFKNSKGSFSFKRNPAYPAIGEYSVVWLPASSGARVYAGDLQINPKTPGTGILNISMMTDNSQMGADIVNKLMDEYAIYTIQQKKESSDKILSFIDDRLDVTGSELDSVQKVLLNFKERNKLIDAEKQSSGYFGNISESDKFINLQKLEQDKAGLINVYQDATLNQLIIEYNKAQIERQQLLDANIPLDNPAVREAESQIEKLRVNMLEAIKNINASIASSIGETRLNNLENQAELQKIPGKVKEQMEIEQHAQSLQNLYKYLQEKREETAITRASTISNSSIIDMAYSTDTPVKPNRKAIQILAILLGLGLPALFIFIGEVLNDKVSTRFDIEKLTSAPILGEIGHSFSNKVLVVSKTTRSMVAEQFRIIRSNLQYILNKSERSTILVTSSFSGEGKSYVTTNMGAVLALAGKKTIILEFDIRKPKILSGLEIQKGPGITNFLVGKANLQDIIKPVPEQENLFVLGCGPVPPNPSELLLDPKMDEMFDWLKANFDVILVDTAPVGMVSDAMTLSKFADSTLYLVRQGHTFKKQIALIDEFYVGNKLPKISIVINDVKIKPGYGYYGYGRYGYGYGYGYGSYYDEEKAPMGYLERLLSKFGRKKISRKK
jgi:capsular exopolysaccharide synthesis family protein